MKLSDIPETFYKMNGQEVLLTKGERSIVKKLRELNSLWKKHGQNLKLYNGDSLFYMEDKGQCGCWNDMIESFLHIDGDGGDPDVSLPN